jgi:hypothetical protein
MNSQEEKRLRHGALEWIIDQYSGTPVVCLKSIIRKCLLILNAGIFSKIGIKNVNQSN